MTRRRARSAVVVKHQALWLDAFRKTGTIMGACRATGIDRNTVRAWLRKDEEFAHKFSDTDLDVTETIESVAISKAVGGDGDLIKFMLKARRPNVYRDNISVNHSGGVTLRDLVIDEEKPAE